ncbi:manganese efflux pump [Eikenella sp. S3360]|uniref:Putative manganese efflux pump MntP n=1 Tax=Eikenella glucosivorans TaxID=2766967 RepID=A0ABS0NC67_9NEIS|nr:manganese efflux pump MntP family protein [Eikenella glucosivorans]MBH5329855.1 manganese efflux pump [Eikenella glucosivorans]
MSFLTILALAFGMSMDAFAAAIAQGADIGTPSRRGILRTAAIFGGVETITPLIGWALGSVAQRYIDDWDHWIAFTLLLLLGLRMIYGGFRADDDVAENPESSSPLPCRRPPGRLMLVVIAFATSIDSMIVGIGLAFLEANILLTALAIGFATTVMAAIGIRLGSMLGSAIGKRAEILGGLVLIGIGILILAEHLHSL